MIYIAVPTYNPDENFIKLMQSLKDNHIFGVIVIDDGSEMTTKHYFKEAEENYNILLLEHSENKGKGRAIKTALEYYIQNIKDGEGIIVIDSDGQHNIESIRRVMKNLKKYPNDLILGVRDFDDKSVPLRSKIGNKFTRAILKKFCNVNVSDSQTGLRGIPNKYISELFKVYGERYEYETNMLIEAVKKGISITEVPIDTIYLNKNKGSNFKTIPDSIRVYKEIIKNISKR